MAETTQEPLGKVEQMLVDMINGEPIVEAPENRIEGLLMELAEAIEQGGGGTGEVTGVKGSAESTYRRGNVNLTAENIGVEAGAEVNTIESITLNGTELTPDANKNVVITVITNAVDNLLNYYLKSETYSKSEVDAIAALLKNGHFIFVTELPTTDIDQSAVYLVPKSSAQTNNVKDEYINLDGTSAGWEKIGDTQIDLSDYVTITMLNTALADYTTTTALTALLDGKVDKVTGKGLSTNDYTDADKDIVDGVATALNGKVDKETGKSLIDLTTVVDGAVYDSTNHLILFKNGTTTLFSLDAAAFVKDGMVDDVKISGGNLVITFNTDAGKQAISIPLTDIFDPANYYTKTATDGLLADKADKVASAVSGNFAGLDSNGNLTDSGKSASDFATGTDIQDRIKETVGWTGRNLYNKAAGKANTIVTQSGESTSSSYSSYNASDYIEVKANTQYYIQNGTGVQTQHTACVYDSSKAFLRYTEVAGLGLQSGIINTGADAKYIRLNVRVEAIDTCMLSKGSDTNVTYEPYHKNVEDSKADKVASATNGNLASLDENGNLADSGIARDGLKYATIIKGTSESPIDLNGFRSAGTWQLKDQDPTYCSNLPSGVVTSNMLLNIIPIGNGTTNEIVQTLYHRNTQVIYVRYGYSINWTAWKSLSYANEGTAAILSTGTDTAQRSWSAKMLRDEFAEASEGVPDYDDLCVIPDSSLTRWVKSGRIVMAELKFEADNRSSDPIQPGRDLFTGFPVPAHEVDVTLKDLTAETEHTVVLTTSGYLRTMTSLTAQHHYYSAQFQYISAS